MELFKKKEPEKKDNFHSIVGESVKNEQHNTLFSHQKATNNLDVSSISEEVNTVSRRIRILEGRYTNLQRKSQLTEQNMLSTNKKVSIEVKTITIELNEIKRDIEEIKMNMNLVIQELKKCAKKEEVRVIKKYVNLWEPVNFVTQNEVEKIVNEIIEEKSKPLYKQKQN